MTAALNKLNREIAACSLCAAHLPLGPRPVTVLRPTARILIIGQAPGTKVHETGVPWNDPSGDRLRDWLQLDRETFYNSPHLAIMPMGFCYPGRAQTKAGQRGGDNPPRPECAPAWHERARALMPDVALTLLVGSYAQRHYLNQPKSRSMTQTVENYQEFLPDYWPLPHPSWRTTGWQKRNPWFEQIVLPALQSRIRTEMQGN